MMAAIPKRIMATFTFISIWIGRFISVSLQVGTRPNPKVGMARPIERIEPSFTGASAQLPPWP